MVAGIIQHAGNYPALVGHAHSFVDAQFFDILVLVGHLVLW
jgi:hypothetical protein